MHTTNQPCIVRPAAFSLCAALALLLVFLLALPELHAQSLGARRSRIPGDPALVSSEFELKKIAALDAAGGPYRYTVADYFSNPTASSFQISPDGTRISYLQKNAKGKQDLYVKDISAGANLSDKELSDKATLILSEGENPISGYAWANNDRFLYTMDFGGDENYRIYAVDADGKNNADLTPFEGVRASVLRILKDKKDIAIIVMNKSNRSVFEPYELNTASGELTRLFENTDLESPVTSYVFDKDGVLRAYSKLFDGINSELYYKNRESGSFELVNTSNWKEKFSILAFSYNSAKPDEAYVATNLQSDKSRIVLYDFAKNAAVKTLFSNATYDVGGIGLSRKRGYEVDFYAYNGEKPVVVPVSAPYKALHETVTKRFPNAAYAVADFDDEERMFLISVQSDTIYGRYYIYDAASKELTLLYDLMPQLKEDDMSPMLPISFKSRDGLTIHGYITLPRTWAKDAPVPLIVNPHGGPQDVRDSWSFNPEAQLFASRGYATLQVNFRISGGYGKKFLDAGMKQVGRKVMNDIEDGVRYAIKKGWADEKRIAIYGASHGGYATLMGLIKTPELYAAGVDYVGPSNIATLLASVPEYWKPYRELLKEVWYDLDDPKEAKIAREVSPVFQVDKITKPLFVVQGANDPRVNIAESDQIVSALRGRGVAVPYMVKYNEGHGFAREENRMEFYNIMLGFLAQYLR